MEKKAFKNHKTNGVELCFPNGNSISTIWGAGSYTENYTKNDYDKQFGSNTAEVMIFCGERLHKKINKKFDNDNMGSVIGHLNITDWLWILNQISREKKH
jgi:hypothetical protein